MSQKQQVKGLLEKIQQSLEELAGDSLDGVFDTVYHNLDNMGEKEVEKNLEGHHLDIKEQLLDDAWKELKSGRSTKNN